MKPGFKISALSLALMIACAPSAYAAKSKQIKANQIKSNQSNNLTSSHWYSTSSGYPMTFAGTVPTSNAWKWSPTAPVMPTNYDQFMVWAEDINAGKSNEPLFNCWNNMFCVGGLLDMDGIYYNHRANAFGTANGFNGVGVRPSFGASTGGFIGSINNANLLFDLKFADLVRVHGDIAYVNGGVKSDSYSFQWDEDFATTYQSAASIKADELYAVFSSPNSYPLYAKIGRFYLDYGNYLPHGYGLPTITPSLTQLMTQTRTGGAQVGFGLQNGVYASATWSMAQQSLLAINRNTINRNYSARLGMMRQYEDAYFNVNASYIWDVRDADYINGFEYYINQRIASNISPFYGAYSSRRQHAYAIHGDGKYGQWGGGIEGSATTGWLNPSRASNVWTAGANINYSFPTVGHDSSLDLSYQVARHSAFVYGSASAFLPPFTGAPFGDFSNQLPKNRVQLTYLAKIVKHVNLGLQLVRDTDFAPPSGSNLVSNFGIVRIDLEV